MTVHPTQTQGKTTSVPNEKPTSECHETSVQIFGTE